MMQDCGCIGQLTVGGSVAVIIGRGFGMQSKSRPKLADREMFYCTKCGHLMHQSARACPECGAPSSVQGWSDISDRSRLTALLLCIFLGIFGVHRFYVGRMGTGILWLLTGGLFGVGVVYDLAIIASGEFEDADGFRVADWEAD